MTLANSDLEREFAYCEHVLKFINWSTDPFDNWQERQFWAAERRYYRMWYNELKANPLYTKVFTDFI